MKVSVIVPVYNVETLLERCLTSLVNQTINDFEIIVINDGPTDGSAEIVHRFASEYPDLFKVIDQKNSGLSASRNRGVERATGKYIYFIDSDDYIKNDTLEIMINLAEKHNLDYIVDGFEQVDEQGNYLELYKIDSVPVNEVINPQENRNLFHIHNAVWNRLYLRDNLINNNLNFKEGIWYEDLLYSHQYYIYSQRAMVINHQALYYVQREGSIMASLGSEKNKDIVTVFKELIKFYEKNNLYNEYRDDIEKLAINQFYIPTMVRLIRANNRQLAKEIDKEFKQMFPNYRSNHAVKELNIKHRLIFNLLNIRLYGPIALMFKFR